MSAQTDILQSTASLHRSWESDWNLQEIQPLEGKKHQIFQLSGCTALHPALCWPRSFGSPPLVTGMATLHRGAGEPK